jgi:hypothetical protein
VPGNFENRELRETLGKRWAVAGHCYPLAKLEPQTAMIAFYEELWESRKGTSVLLRAMQERAMARSLPSAD